jgi:hypothetical protein
MMTVSAFNPAAVFVSSVYSALNHSSEHMSAVVSSLAFF